MKFSAFTDALQTCPQVRFKKQDGDFVPAHFHITKVAQIEKRAVDCGGNFQKEAQIILELWVADDFHHRISGQKLLDIILSAKAQMNLHADTPVFVELQGHTVERYGLDLEEGYFRLNALQTDCPVKERCCLPPPSTEKACVAGSCCC